MFTQEGRKESEVIFLDANEVCYNKLIQTWIKNKTVEFNPTNNIIRVHLKKAK